ncbi:MAG TPA: dihydroorotate dehydrogenase electron transfer subunit, partial [Candidatus Pullichristensenella stercoripullorum]|nr:dihydroorotate dehydrogenase electron transfer subunit [Candidatus Pullichristensenella stercoripullorum]
QVTAALGFGGAREAILVDDLRALGADVRVATMDGSMGIKGLVTDLFPTLAEPTYFYACGPAKMLAAVENALPCDGEMSYEERMGCGFGACVGCTCQTKNGAKRVCKDGPVFKKGEVLS